MAKQIKEEIMVVQEGEQLAAEQRQKEMGTGIAVLATDMDPRIK